MSRGYVGLTLQRTRPGPAPVAAAGAVQGALVQDVVARLTRASGPGSGRTTSSSRSIGEPVRTNDDLIRRIALRSPGIAGEARGRARRPRAGADRAAGRATVRGARRRTTPGPAPGARPQARRGRGRPHAAVLLGLNVRDLDRAPDAPAGTAPGPAGRATSRASTPLSGAAEAGFAHGRHHPRDQPAAGDVDARVPAADSMAAADGTVLVFLCYVPELDQRVLRTRPRRDAPAHEAAHPGHRRRGGDPRLDADDPRVRGLRVPARARPGPTGWRWSSARSRTSCSSTSRCRAWTASRSSTGSRRQHEGLPVVMISGHGTVSTGGGGHQARGVRLHREAARASERVLVTVRNALAQERLSSEVRQSQARRRPAPRDDRPERRRSAGDGRHPARGPDHRPRC